MKYTTKDIELSEDIEFWLRSIYELEEAGEEYSYRSLRTRLYDKLSKDFDHKQIDNRIYTGKHLTLFGMALIDPESKVVKMAEELILEIKKEILTNPDRIVFQATDLANRLKTDKIIISKLFNYLSDIGHFWSSASGTGQEGEYASIEIGSDDNVNEYMRFEGLQAIFDRIGKRITTSNGNKARLNEIAYPGIEKKTIKSYEANTAFIIMSMNPENPELEDIYNTIKEVCEAFDIQAVRVDEIEHSGLITDVILKKIQSSEFLIADITGEKPNVYYEIGYAHAIDKRPIILRKAGTPLHFDLAGHNIPEYTNNTHLKRILKKRFEAITGRTI